MVLRRFFRPNTTNQRTNFGKRHRCFMEDFRFCVNYYAVEGRHDDMETAE